MLELFSGAPNECDKTRLFAVNRWRLIVCFSVISLTPLSSGEPAKTKELRREILSNYNKTVAPGFEGSPTDIGIVYFSRRIHNLDESAGTLTVEGGLWLKWMDSRLTWTGDPKYQNITWITVNSDAIWTPKINVFNSGRTEVFSNTRNSAYLLRTGKIAWMLSAELHPTCKPEDLRWYPTDTHICTLSLGTLYPQEMSDLITGQWSRLATHGLKRRKDEGNQHWQLLNLEHQGSFKLTRNAMFYPTDDFIFTIRRQGCSLLATFLPLMTCCILLSWSSFALPSHGRQLTKRMSVAACPLLLSAVLLLVLIRTVPGVGQKPPIIVKVNLCVVILTFLTSLHAIVVSRVYLNPTTHFSCLQKLPVPLQRLLGLNKTPAGGNGLLANMECTPDSSQEYSPKELVTEVELEVVGIAYSRAHLILQASMLALTMVFLCLV